MAEYKACVRLTGEICIMDWEKTCKRFGESPLHMRAKWRHDEQDTALKCWQTFLSSVIKMNAMTKLIPILRDDINNYDWQDLQDYKERALKFLSELDNALKR
jgi:hypothetical protein